MTGFGHSRFSSDDLRPVDRVPYYVDVIGQMVARFDKQPVPDGFSCDADFYRLPDLGIASIAITAGRANRTRVMTEGTSELILHVALEGALNASQRNREISVAGQSALVSTEYPLHVEHTRGRFVLVAVPRAVLAPMLSDPDAALMTVIPNTIEPLCLLRSYIDLLIKDPTLIDSPEVRRVAAQHVHDLVALAHGATRDAAETAAGRGLRAARMRAIKADILENLAADVTVDALATRHGLSPRYIRKLFEGEDTSLSKYVLGQRLTRVYRMLADPRHANRTIGDIVFAAGFGDLSTFNREFRRNFGVRPSDVRHGSHRYPHHS